MARERLFFLLLLAAAEATMVAAASESANKSSPDQTLIESSEAIDVDHGRKIVNGTRARRGQFPFVVGLAGRGSRRPYCGGSLISNKFVMTACHCVYGKRTSAVRALLGDLIVGQQEDGERLMAVCSIKCHPHYGGTMHGVADDIALLRLCSDITFSDVIQPVALENPDAMQSPGSTVHVAGWGTIREGGPLSHSLLYASIQIVGLRDCKRPYPFVNVGQICAGLPRGGTDSCQGDSGGPLWRVDERSRRRVQIGIVSNGRGCARPGYPGVYTDVGAYFHWILEVMAEDAF